MINRWKPRSGWVSRLVRGRLLNHNQPRSGRVSRLVRGRRLDHNPLRRPSDRAETVIMAGLLAAFLTGAPFAAMVGGAVTNGSARQAQQSQLSAERKVTATTTQGAQAPTTYGQAYVSVRARWTAPDGKSTTGQIPVVLGTPAGTQEQLWTTFSGQIASPPLLGSQIADLTMLGRGASVVALLLVLAAARALARHELDRRRLAAWGADWQAVDSYGSKRR